MRYAAFNINFDSLNEMYGFPEDYKDFTYSEVSQRFFALSDKYRFKYSIFVIGKDLEKAENREWVREWALKGHEIGNHSWSHPLNLGALRPSEIRREVESAHDLIAKAAGREPKGFIAPGWSNSEELVKVLVDLGYTYDTSGFPSWLMYLSLLKMLILNFGDQRFGKILNRGDLLSPFCAPRRPFWTSGKIYKGGNSAPSEKGLVELPIPTNRLRIACWHTIGFIFGWPFHERLLDSCLKEIEAFYYLMHPGDLLDKTDLSFPGRILMERLAVPLDEKRHCLEKSVRRILEDGREIVTMEKLAEKMRPS